MKRTIILSLLGLFALVLLSSCFYVVNQDQVAVVKSLGRVVSTVVDPMDVSSVQANLDRNEKKNINIIQEKGLHFKVPFVQDIELYDSKFLTYISSQETINTKDNRRIEIQMYAQYRVLDPVTYKLAVGDAAKANNIMDQLVYLTVIQSANTLEFNEFFYQNTLNDLLDSKQEALNAQLLKDYGMYVSDIGVNRKNFPLANVQSIEEKMTLQIQKESEKLTAEGDSEYLQKQAIADREKAEIVSAAVEKAAIIKAEADAQAISIYQNSLKKDLEFYRFIKRMEIYKQLKDTTIFVDQDNDIFDMLNGYDATLLQ